MYDSLLNFETKMTHTTKKVVKEISDALVFNFVPKKCAILIRFLPKSVVIFKFEPRYRYDQPAVVITLIWNLHISLN